MRRAYVLALVAAALGLSSILWGVASASATPGFVLLCGAGFAPAAVLFAVWGRVGGRFPVAAVLLGAILAPILALIGEGMVVAFTATFVHGFADSGRRLLESLRADPQLTTALTSPWVLVLLVDVTAVAPLTEEAVKGLAARMARPQSRRGALLLGVAAGTGFAITENVMYASLAWSFGGPWPFVSLSRSMGAAVHPLACGLVMLGWWEWRQNGRLGSMVRGFLAGAGVHALWNGSVVVVGVVESVLSTHGTLSLSLRPVALTYAAILGAVLAGALALTTLAVDGRVQVPTARLRQRRALAGWTVLAASALVPLAVLVIAFPSFYRG